MSLAFRVPSPRLCQRTISTGQRRRQICKEKEKNFKSWTTIEKGKSRFLNQESEFEYVFNLEVLNLSLLVVSERPRIGLVYIRTRFGRFFIFKGRNRGFTIFRSYL